MATGVRADDTYKPPTGKSNGGTTGKSGGNTQTSDGSAAAVFLPKWQDDIFVDTSSSHGVSMASDPWSATYVYGSSKSGAYAEFGSGQGYMNSGMTDYLNAVAHAIHPLKTGKSLWEDANDAAAALWANHQVKKTPYQIISEWASEIKPKTSGGGSDGSGRGSGGLGAATPGVEQVRRAMDSVSNGLIGRTLSDKEFAQYYQHFSSDFASTGGNMDMAQNATEFVRKDDNYEEYQVATKFASALDSVLKGAL